MPDEQEALAARAAMLRNEVAGAVHPGRHGYPAHGESERRQLAAENVADGSHEALSISDRAGAVLAVVSTGRPVGCDIELVEPRSDAFVADYFTADEWRSVQVVPPGVRALVANLVWACKESAAKALRVGLNVDMRSLAVSVAPSVRGGRAAVLVRHETGELRGWWRRYERFVVSVVFGPASSQKRMPKVIGMNVALPA